MNGIVILDNVLSDDELYNFKIGIKGEPYGADNLHKWNDMKIFHPLFKKISKIFHTKRHYMYEVWQHQGTLPNGWHVDKDEILHDQTGIVDCPLLALTYYPFIDNLIDGGRLLFKEGIAIVPRTNRIVIQFLPSRWWHNVEDYEGGYRQSININVWNKKILGSK